MTKNEIHFLNLCAHANIISIAQHHPQGVLLPHCLTDLQRLYDMNENMPYLHHWRCQLVAALSHLKETSIIHRDIKLANILVTHEHNVLLTDFNLAMSPNTKCQLSGTPNYLHPSLLQGHPPSYGSDMYALGICFYALVMRKLPFHASTAKDTLKSILRHQYDQCIPINHSYIEAMMECHTPTEIMQKYPLPRFNTLFLPSIETKHLCVRLNGDLHLPQFNATVHMDHSVTLEKHYTLNPPLKGKCAMLKAQYYANKLYKKHHQITIDTATLWRNGHFHYIKDTECVYYHDQIIQIYRQDQLHDTLSINHVPLHYKPLIAKAQQALQQCLTHSQPLYMTRTLPINEICLLYTSPSPRD